jgi:hypothetical protein
MSRLGNKKDTKVPRENCQLTYKDKNITLRARKVWSNIIQTLRDNNCHKIILYPIKLSFNFHREINLLE